MSTPVSVTHDLSIFATPGKGVRIEVEDKKGRESTVVIEMSPHEAKKLGDEVFKAACIAEAS